MAVNITSSSPPQAPLSSPWRPNDMEPSPPSSQGDDWEHLSQDDLASMGSSEGSGELVEKEEDEDSQFFEKEENDDDQLIGKPEDDTHSIKKEEDNDEQLVHKDENDTQLIDEGVDGNVHAVSAVSNSSLSQKDEVDTTQPIGKDNDDNKQAISGSSEGSPSEKDEADNDDVSVVSKGSPSEKDDDPNDRSVSVVSEDSLVQQCEDDNDRVASTLSEGSLIEKEEDDHFRTVSDVPEGSPSEKQDDDNDDAISVTSEDSASTWGSGGGIQLTEADKFELVAGDEFVESHEASLPKDHTSSSGSEGITEFFETDEMIEGSGCFRFHKQTSSPGSVHSGDTVELEDKDDEDAKTLELTPRKPLYKGRGLAIGDLLDAQPQIEQTIDWHTVLPCLIKASPDAPFAGPHRAVEIPCGPNCNNYLHIPRNISWNDRQAIRNAIEQIWTRWEPALSVSGSDPALIPFKAFDENGLDMCSRVFNWIPASAWKFRGPSKKPFPITPSHAPPFSRSHCPIYILGTLFNGYYMHIPRYLSRQEVINAERNVAALCSNRDDWDEGCEELARVHLAQDPSHVENGITFNQAQKNMAEIFERHLGVDFTAQDGSRSTWGPQGSQLWTEDESAGAQQQATNVEELDNASDDGILQNSGRRGSMFTPPSSSSDERELDSPEHAKKTAMSEDEKDYWKRQSLELKEQEARLKEERDRNELLFGDSMLDEDDTESVVFASEGPVRNSEFAPVLDNEAIVVEEQDVEHEDQAEELNEPASMGEGDSESDDMPGLRPASDQVSLASISSEDMVEGLSEGEANSAHSEHADDSEADDMSDLIAVQSSRASSSIEGATEETSSGETRSVRYEQADETTAVDMPGIVTDLSFPTLSDSGDVAEESSEGEALSSQSEAADDSTSSGRVQSDDDQSIHINEELEVEDNMDDSISDGNVQDRSRNDSISSSGGEVNDTIGSQDHHTPSLDGSDSLVHETPVNEAIKSSTDSGSVEDNESFTQDEQGLESTQTNDASATEAPTENAHAQPGSIQINQSTGEDWTMASDADDDKIMGEVQGAGAEQGASVDARDPSDQDFETLPKVIVVNEKGEETSLEEFEEEAVLDKLVGPSQTSKDGQVDHVEEENEEEARIEHEELPDPRTSIPIDDNGRFGENKTIDDGQNPMVNPIQSMLNLGQDEESEHDDAPEDVAPVNKQESESLGASCGTTPKNLEVLGPCLRTLPPALCILASASYIAWHQKHFPLSLSEVSTLLTQLSQLDMDKLGIAADGLKVARCFVANQIACETPSLAALLRYDLKRLLGDSVAGSIIAALISTRTFWPWSNVAKPVLAGLISLGYLLGRPFHRLIGGAVHLACRAYQSVKNRTFWTFERIAYDAAFVCLAHACACCAGYSQAFHDRSIGNTDLCRSSSLPSFCGNLLKTLVDAAAAECLGMLCGSLACVWALWLVHLCRRNNRGRMKSVVAEWVVLVGLVGFAFHMGWKVATVRKATARISIELGNRVVEVMDETS